MIKDGNEQTINSKKTVFSIIGDIKLFEKNDLI